MRQLLIGLTVICLYTQVTAQQPNTPITGWKMQEDNGHYSFAPATLFGTANFHYDVYPPRKGVDDLGAFLTKAAEIDVQTSGYTIVPNQSKSQDVKSFRIYSVLVKDAAGRQWLLNYMAYERPDKAIRYGRITEIPVAASKSNMNTAVQHFIKLSKQEGGLTTAGSTANTASNSTSGNSGSTASSSASQTSTASKSTSKRPETPTTAPGQGIKPSDLKAVVLHQEYGVGVGGMMIIKYNPYLLLNDGTIYEHPYVPAYDLDVTRSRQEEPKKWGRYKIEGTTLIVTMNGDDKTERWEGRAKWFFARPGGKDEKLNGTWSTIGGGGNTAMGGGSMVVSSTTLTFNKQGQFTTESVGGGSFSGSTGTVTAYSGKNSAGTYQFDGFCLTLKYNNGTTVRKNFCFYDESQEVWVFGTSPYTPDDATKKQLKGSN